MGVSAKTTEAGAGTCLTDRKMVASRVSASTTEAATTSTATSNSTPQALLGDSAADLPHRDPDDGSRDVIEGVLAPRPDWAMASTKPTAGF